MRDPYSLPEQRQYLLERRLPGKEQIEGRIFQRGDATFLEQRSDVGTALANGLGELVVDRDHLVDRPAAPVARVVTSLAADGNACANAPPGPVYRGARRFLVPSSA